MSDGPNHYEWIGAMYCENEMECAGDFDSVQTAGECPSCGAAL